MFAVEHQIHCRYGLGWVEKFHTHPDYQRCRLAAAARAALHSERPGLRWRALGGHFPDGFSFFLVEAAPTVCIWGWPDRSDSCLQAYLDTIASGATDPVTVILPDVPAFRKFARRYIRREPTANSERTLIEDHLYRMPSDMPNKRGTILSAEFAPRLVVHPDGSEDDGALLMGAVAYLDARHTLRLSVWDVLRDPLLRGVAMTTRPLPRPFGLSGSDRTDIVSWYGRNTEYDESDVLRPYRPSLLDVVS